MVHLDTNWVWPRVLWALTVSSRTDGQKRKKENLECKGGLLVQVSHGMRWGRKDTQIGEGQCRGTTSVRLEVGLDITNNIVVGKRIASELPSGADRLLSLQKWGPTTNSSVGMAGWSEPRGLDWPMCPPASLSQQFPWLQQQLPTGFAVHGRESSADRDFFFFFNCCCRHNLGR